MVDKRIKQDDMMKEVLEALDVLEKLEKIEIGESASKEKLNPFSEDGVLKKKQWLEDNIQNKAL